MTIQNIKQHIYIADKPAITDTNTLKEKEIKSVTGLTTGAFADHNVMDEIRFVSFALLDSGDNPQEQVDAAVYHVAGEIESGENTLIYCNVAMNRSPAILAAAMALVEEEKFSDKLNEIKSTHPPTSLNTGIAKQAEKAVKRFRDGRE